MERISILAASSLCISMQRLVLNPVAVDRNWRLVQSVRFDRVSPARKEGVLSRTPPNEPQMLPAVMETLKRTVFFRMIVPPVF
jgi:hypothetical protein